MDDKQIEQQIAKNLNQAMDQYCQALDQHQQNINHSNMQNAQNQLTHHYRQFVQNTWAGQLQGYVQQGDQYGTYQQRTAQYWNWLADKKPKEISGPDYSAITRDLSD